MDEFDITKGKKQFETEAKKLASRADNFKEFEDFDMDKPGILQTLAFVFLGFVQDLFLRQDKIDKRNLEITLNMNSTIIPPTKASGFVNFVGNIGGTIPAGTIITDRKTSCDFTTLADGVINFSSNSGKITAIEENYFIITTDNDHDLSSGLTVNLNFLDNENLNSEEIIIALSEKTLRVDKKIDSENLSKNIVVSLNKALVPVESVENGAINNETDGVILALAESIADINDGAYVYILGITGGRDAQIIRGDNEINNAGIFGEENIKQVVLQMKGVTRVFVLGPNNYLTEYNPESIRFLENVAIVTKTSHGSESNSRIIVKGSPYPQFNGEFDILKIDEDNFLYWMSNAPSGTPETNEILINAQLIPCGSVKVFFVKDEQDNILPTLSEISDVKNAIYNIAPINVSKQNIIVKAPTLKPLNIKATYIGPNTTTVKEAMNEALKSFFVSNSVTLGSTVYINDIIAVMNGARDSKGQAPQGLKLLEPTANVVSGPEELIVLGDIEYV